MKDETMGNQQATDVELGWLAGIIDGEGYLGFSHENRRKSRCVRTDMQIVNCDIQIIDRAKRILNKMGINPYLRERCHDKETWKTNYILTVSTFANLKMLFDSILDHLTGQKQCKGRLMLRLINSRIGKTRGDKYTGDELSIVNEYFLNHYPAVKGASTTIRKDADSSLPA